MNGSLLGVMVALVGLNVVGGMVRVRGSAQVVTGCSMLPMTKTSKTFVCERSTRLQLGWRERIPWTKLSSGSMSYPNNFAKGLDP